jgi:hypothetical protein
MIMSKYYLKIYTDVEIADQQLGKAGRMFAQLRAGRDLRQSLPALRLKLPNWK